MSSNKPEIGSVTRTKAIMETYGLTFKKSLGQNFLTDLNVLKNIVAAAQISADDDVLEIGPGIGALTEQLAKNAHQVLAVELDQRLLPVLKETLADYDNVQVIHGDILQVQLAEVLAEHFDGQHPVKIVANLPYYITTPIVLHLLAEQASFSSITVMMQKEVAQRLTAQPGTKDYGSLTVGVTYATETEIAFTVPKTVFIPSPKVDSAIVVMKKRTELQQKPQNEKNFRKLIRGSFMHKRKSLWNNLLALYGKEPEIKTRLEQALETAEIAPGIRAERLSVADFIRLSDSLENEALEPK
ncbi:dimethyladenosine transferase [Ligilactobacillus salitolerans]|uniref:Ribosomal RNA small subunit methyltransferase A n=1 Tax=Ligilactobacillus salitolerans TaxID=1808352 RepID=A0A401IS52_9LACO|nr:16S rRNA (adenine(1518)-N(6)/adenine(1519)-N(6))-dimethyltransferase RsmA [Ligilactobacillus salitolerans]GBG94359.1 dimethyladenosine transferase [Ligilactobacillus salitolerans]